jgi:hypothetical protein
MTYIPYEPPRPEFESVLTAFQVIAGPRMAVRIDVDPLGPVNRIVRLMAGERCIKSALAHIPSGAAVRLLRDEGGYSIREMFGAVEQIWDARTEGREPPEIAVIQPPGWRVEVDDRTVLQVFDSELRPPPPPPPKVPWRTRTRREINRRARAAADAVAKRLGYHRDGECEGDDDW